MVTITILSLTYANKFKKVLETNGYSSKIVHKVKPTGCEYVITVKAPKDVVLKLLKDNHIPTKR
jgi:hypothetical protein